MPTGGGGCPSKNPQWSPSTPRRAPSGTSSPLATRDHPRMCGEQLHKIIHDTYFLGSSPRVRGAVDGAPRLRIVQGIIPARAGSSAQYICRACREGDHPRACGEQLPYQMRAATSLGSSPRVRGAGISPPLLPLARGIIPARAGSSKAMQRAYKDHRDHPRACGEQPDVCNLGDFVSGSSPRVRGAGALLRAGVHALGIIPARAGSRSSCLNRRNT